MIKEKYTKLILPAFILIITLQNLTSCKSCSTLPSENQRLQRPIPQAHSEKKIHKVIFFLENSESMFGFVSGYSEYVDVISELAEKPEFAAERTTRDFYFVNGNDLKINYIGNDPKIFKGKLNFIKDFWIWSEGNYGSGSFGFAHDLYIALRFTLMISLTI